MTRGAKTATRKPVVATLNEPLANSPATDTPKNTVLDGDFVEKKEAIRTAAKPMNVLNEALPIFFASLRLCGFERL